VKLLRVLRLDASDNFVFPHAAEAGEIAVVGSFLFWDRDTGILQGKERAAFRSGFLGIESFGRSTLVEIFEADAPARAEAVEKLASQLVALCGAPDLESARPAAEEEIAFAESLAERPLPGTALALRRVADGSATREEFRMLARRSLDEAKLDPRHWRAFTFYETDDMPAAETVDLVGLAQEERK
jgi:hypothetical protein